MARSIERKRAVRNFNPARVRTSGRRENACTAGDTLAAARIPFIEVHLSNIFAREIFRKKSYFSDLAVGVVSGLGTQGYELALQYALARIHAEP